MTMSIILISVSELLLGRVAELASFAFTALFRMRETALLNIYLSLTKLICIIILAAVKPHPTVQDWSLAYFIGSFACFLYAFIRIHRISGISLDLAACKREMLEGSYFAIGTSAATIYNDIDKTMLARLSDLASTGIYGAAYRIIEVSMSPIRAMSSSAYPEFFRLGVNGPQTTYNYAKKLIRHAAPLGLAIFVGLFLGAPILPLVLGKSFAHSVEAVRWLAILPLIRCGHVFLGDALSGAGFQGVRTLAQVFVAVVNIALNIYFIRHWTWRGAAWTSIMCDALLALSFAAVLIVVKRKSVGAQSPSAVVEHATRG
jgi:O-antigen/teichoic acid export membrane protein